MVLELLVGDEEHDHDEAADPVRLDEDHGRDDDRRERRARERDQVEDGDEQTERNREPLPTANSTTVASTPAARLMRRLPVT